MALDRHRRLAERYIATFTPPSSTKENDNGNGNGNGSKATSTTSPSSDPATSIPVPASVPTTSSANSAPTTSSTSSVHSTTSSSTPSSSAAPTTSAGPAVVTVHSTATFNTPQPSFTLITGSLGPATTATPSATGTPASSSGSINVTAVVGGIAGTLVGLAAVVFLVMWLMRRRKDNDDEDFNASIFRRQSAILQDDPAPSFNPRPPTMIERHVTNASPALAAQRGMPSGGQNFYGGYGSFGPGEIIQPAYGQPVMGYGESGQLARQPSNAAYLTRQPTAAGHGATFSPEDNDAHYVDLNRSSVTPFQAAQYADISRRLNAMDTPRVSEDLHRAPLPSPFDDHPAEVTHTTPAPAAQAPAPGGRQPPSDAQRPASAYSVFEEGDAYGGI